LKMDAQGKSETVKAKALGLGFDACAIAAITEIDPEDRLGDWLAQGFHADMAWMETQKAVRQDIRLKLPGAKSVVVVAKNYYRSAAPQPPGSGKVARYAWGRDYHKVMRKPLVALAECLGGLGGGVETYLGIDSAPIMERAWAAQSGLGWIGKNSLVLRRDLGSWFFLGAVATTLELQPDAPVADNCGTCTACIDACPTRAIVAEGVVDSSRCISYHTIENRGAIPEELARNFGDWVFGCDICQDICPWNRFAKENTEANFTPRSDAVFPDLRGLLALSEEDFNKKYEGSPIRRAKHAGMQRNAGIAIENLKTKGKISPD